MISFNRKHGVVDKRVKDVSFGKIYKPIVAVSKFLLFLKKTAFVSKAGFLLTNDKVGNTTRVGVFYERR